MPDAIARIEPAGPQGMVSLRADLSAPEVAAAVQAVAGCDIPAPRRIVTAGGNAVAWMSPDELLILLPHAEAPGTVARLGEALAGVHHLAVEVSDARALFRIRGEGADDVVAKLCPVDIDRLPEGELRRTRAAQVAAALWRSGPGEISLVAFRSVEGYVERLLQVAAEGGRL
jgi:sarcosine oxidase subunit gamma